MIVPRGRSVKTGHSTDIRTVGMHAHITCIVTTGTLSANLELLDTPDLLSDCLSAAVPRLLRLCSGFLHLKVNNQSNKQHTYNHVLITDNGYNHMQLLLVGMVSHHHNDSHTLPACDSRKPTWERLLFHRVLAGVFSPIPNKVKKRFLVLVRDNCQSATTHLHFAPSPSQTRPSCYPASRSPCPSACLQVFRTFATREEIIFSRNTTASNNK